MEIQILLVLIIAFIVLGPERMMDVAVKLGEMMRKVREVWDEIRVQTYMEEVNRKVLEDTGSETEDKTEDEIEEYVEDISPEYEEGGKEEDDHDEHKQQRTAPDNASNGASEGAQDKTD